VKLIANHRDPKAVLRYDHVLENLDQIADNFLGYEDKSW
jgi:hypothetical protein